MTIDVFREIAHAQCWIKVQPNRTLFFPGYVIGAMIKLGAIGWIGVQTASRWTLQIQ